MRGSHDLRSRVLNFGFLDQVGIMRYKVSIFPKIINLMLERISMKKLHYFRIFEATFILMLFLTLFWIVTMPV